MPHSASADMRQSAKALFKPEEQNRVIREGCKYITKAAKPLKKVLTCDTIQLENEDKIIWM